MSFRVKIRTGTRTYEYYAIAFESAALFADIYDRFGICAVSVRPVRQAGQPTIH